MKVYKGTDKGMNCRGLQYELGVTVKSDDAIRCGDKGFHSCEAPFDVLRYYPNNDGNRFFVATADGKIDRTGADDSKIASSEITLDAEISFDELRMAQIEYTRKKAESGECGGYGSNLAGGYGSNLAGGYGSNLAGGDRSNIAGGYGSNLAGGYGSNLAGGYGSNLAGGYGSNIAGGYGSNLAGGDVSNLAGGDRSLIVGRNNCSAKAGFNSVIVLSEWKTIDGKYTPIYVKAEIVDGKRIKADTWYKLVDGEFTEVE